MEYAPVEWLSIMEHLNTTEGDLTADVETVMESLLQAKNLTQWILGDAILRIGSSKLTREHFTKLSGESESAIKSYMTTCSSWKPETRWALIHEYKDKYPLKFSMFKELNSLVNDPKYGLVEAERVLRHAGDNAFTIAELKRYIAVDVKGGEPKSKNELIEDYEFKPSEDGYIENIPLPVPVPVGMGSKYRVKFYEVIEPDVRS